VKPVVNSGCVCELSYRPAGRHLVCDYGIQFTFREFERVMVTNRCVHAVKTRPARVDDWLRPTLSLIDTDRSILPVAAAGIATPSMRSGF
jgi:hypothetical protein